MSLAPSEAVRKKILDRTWLSINGETEDQRLSALLDELEDAIDKEYDMPDWKNRLIYGFVMVVFVIPIIASISAGAWMGTHHHTLFKVAFLVFYAVEVCVYFILEYSFFRMVNYLGRKFSK